jgi:hypothetical protein
LKAETPKLAFSFPESHNSHVITNKKMNLIMHKIKRAVVTICIPAACLILAAITLLPPATVVAASQVYGIGCVSSDVVVHAHSVSCSVSAATPKLYEIGSTAPARPYPAGYGLTVVSVDCGRSTPEVPAIGQPVDFKCHNHSSPTVKTKTVLQKSTGAGVTSNGGNPACEAGDATCSMCGNNPNAAGCPCAGANQTACSDNAVNCNFDGCDLIQKYINPAIDLASVSFGLLAAASLILGGINYASSEGDPQKASQAKNRLSKTIVAVVAYLFLYSFLQFIVPGGVFNR